MRNDHPDRLSRLRAAVAEVRAIDADVADLEDQIKQKKAYRAKLVENEIPDLMEGVPGLDLAAGPAATRVDISVTVTSDMVGDNSEVEDVIHSLQNLPNTRVTRTDLDLPATRVEVGTAYHASIAAGWEPARRREAFDWFDDHEQGEMIDTVVTLTFPRKARGYALRLVDEIRRRMLHDACDSVSLDVTESIHWKRLTSWLKETYQKGKDLPPLEKIGATIKRVATVRPLKKG
jgi:hypothetical protein